MNSMIKLTISLVNFYRIEVVCSGVAEWIWWTVATPEGAKLCFKSDVFSLYISKCVWFCPIVHATCGFNDGIMKIAHGELQIVPLIVVIDT